MIEKEKRLGLWTVFYFEEFHLTPNEILNLHSFVRICTTHQIW